jgi:hypothetical protein
VAADRLSIHSTGMTSNASPVEIPPERISEARRLLRTIAIVALVDFVLLVPLVIAGLVDNEPLTSVLGPVHGVAFLVELFLAARGAGERLWGWWFPALVALTAGPLGALTGHRWVSRRLDAASAVTRA